MDGSHLHELRKELSRQGLAGLIVPRADEHLGEYVPANAERLAWVSGFNGSAGLAIVLADRASLFVDGRYVLQAEAQTDPMLWERRHITQEPPAEWLAATVPAATRVGYDPLLLSEETLARFTNAGCAMVACEDNPVDLAWRDRPEPPLFPACIHPLDLSGRSASDKCSDIAAELRRGGQDAAILNDPASIAWLLNLRGGDVPFTPVPLGFAIIRADASVELFMDGRKLPPPVRAWLGNTVTVLDRGALAGALATVGGLRVRVDPRGAPAWFAQRLRAAGATVVGEPDPCLLPKARKNEVEQEGARVAHRRDAVAVCRFLHWLSATPRTGLTEGLAAARLLALRAEQPDFRQESFPAISAAGEHGAIMHYRVDAASDRAIGHDEMFLIDSGAQYGCGTTDVTRTVWTGPGVPPDELRDRYTRVLRGHVAIATLRFPHGVGGAHLDGFARHALWQAGLDFDHGTGHGVGSYLSVHEGPVSLSRRAPATPIEAGMTLSNEPGFYAPGRYGIRLENLVLVRPSPVPRGGTFLEFETLTLAPFDRALVDSAMLAEHERAWLDAYHARVLAEIGPALEQPARAWLALACRALA